MTHATSTAPTELRWTRGRAHLRVNLAWMRIDDGPCIAEPSQLEYIWTHHNFEDEAHLTIGDVEHVGAAEIQLVEPFAIVTTYRARRVSDEVVLLGPEVLVHVVGPTWPF